jgi:hypothetical protein
LHSLTAISLGKRPHLAFAASSALDHTVAVVFRGPFAPS